MKRTPAGQTRRRIYEFMRQRLLEGSPPTTREVQHAFGFRAVQSAREHLEALVTAGLLAKQPGRARGYHLPGRPGAAISTCLVPLLGRVQAGELTTALEEPEGYIHIESRLAQKQLFALHVRGNSMKNAAILHDDIVIVHRQPTAAHGEIVVALVGEEATVKRLRRKGRRVELHAENPDFTPIIPRSGELLILGKVIEVRRFLETR